MTLDDYLRALDEWDGAMNAAGALQALGVEENGGFMSTLIQRSSLIANDGTRLGQHAKPEHGEIPDPAAPYLSCECDYLREVM